MDPIYVKEEDIPVTETRKDFIRRFLRNTSPPSYSDRRCTIVQCTANRYRSITELHQLTLSRFPKTSFEAIIRIVKTLIDEDACVSMVWCTQVNKVVLKYFDKATKTYITNTSRNNYYDSKGVDGYSLRDYETMFNELTN